MTAKVSGALPPKTGTNIDDGFGSAGHRRRVLDSARRAVNLNGTRAARVVGSLDNLATLVTIGRKIITKGK